MSGNFQIFLYTSQILRQTKMTNFLDIVFIRWPPVKCYPSGFSGERSAAKYQCTHTKEKLSDWLPSSTRLSSDLHKPKMCPILRQSQALLTLLKRSTAVTKPMLSLPICDKKKIVHSCTNAEYIVYCECEYANVF